MTDLELERMLAGLPVAAPDPARERELLALLRTPPAISTSWWTRRIPVWQAAAACVAVFAASLIWLRDPPPPQPAPAGPVVVKIDQPLFAQAASAGELIDVSRWAALPSGRD